MIERLLRYLILPREVTPFETAYLTRMNRLALIIFWLHLPVYTAIASVTGGSRAVEALVLTVAVLVGPTVASVALVKQQRLVSVVNGVTAMLFGAVLVYINRGVMQIEMHFYFFVLIALLSVFGNPMVVIAAATTVALHHLVLFIAMPESVFNYEATWWSVGVHAVFVVLESVAACFVGRSFFDNVLGLQRIVTSRNQDLARILDNVAQGYVTVGFDGTIGAERSRALTEWFGEPGPDMRWWDYMGRTPDDVAWLRLGFEGLVEDFMPIEATLDQFPKRTNVNGRDLELEYKPIGSPPSQLLVVVSDVTAEVKRKVVEKAQRELVAVLDQANHDRPGFSAFMREAAVLTVQCVEATTDLPTLRRALHTLKGNAGLFGATSLVETAHTLESELGEQEGPLTDVQRNTLWSTWTSFQSKAQKLGLIDDRSVIVPRREFDAVARQVEPQTAPWAQRIVRWGLDPTRPHLERLGHQAVVLARKLEKAELVVKVADNNVRVDGERFQPVFAALVHAVRNAVNHGIESLDERIEAGKPESATLMLTTQVVAGNLIIEIRDDGAGIDWERVLQRATERGIPALNRKDLEAVLFSGGVSTMSTVTEVAGRGVGLDALRTACRALGGEVEIDSERGKGTLVRCVVSLEARRGMARVSA